MGEYRNDIITNFKTNGANKALGLVQQVQKSTKNFSNDFKKNLGNLRGSTAQLGSSISKAMEGMKSRSFIPRSTDIIKDQKAQQGYWDSYFKGVKGAEKVTRGFASTAKKFSGAFQGWALSIMFFGMAIQRVFTNLWKQGSKAFQEISHSVENSTTGFDMLEGSMKFLWFTVGNALEPIAMFLLPIIDAVATWVTENEGLARVLVIVGSVLGFILFVVGTLVLGIAGLITSFGIITPILASAGAAIGGLGVAFLIAAGIIAAIILLWKSDLGGFRDFVKGVFGVISNTMGAVFNHLWNIVKDVMGIIVAIFEGDWDKVLELTVDLFKNLLALTTKGLMGIGALIINVFSFTFNLVVDIIFKIVVGLITFIGRKWIDLAQWMINLLKPIADKIGLGNVFSSMEKSLQKSEDMMTTIADKAAEFGDSIKKGYISGEDLKSGFSAIDTTLGLDSGSEATSTTQVTNIQQVVIENPQGFDDAIDQVNRSSYSS